MMLKYPKNLPKFWEKLGQSNTHKPVVNLQLGLAKNIRHFHASNCGLLFLSLGRVYGEYRAPGPENRLPEG